MASLEEPLLEVEKVRHEEQNGTLYLMGERLAWCPDGLDRYTVSHRYEDICRIAVTFNIPEIPIMLELHNGQRPIFYFEDMMRAGADTRDVCIVLQEQTKKFQR